MFGLFKKYTFKDIPLVDMQSLKRRIKIVVIDDEKDSFPLEQIQDFGFTVEYWNIINADRLKRLENKEFDVIILDIKGVVDRSLGKLDGLNILTALKEKNKEQIIIAFSGSKYDISKGEFFRGADGFFKKPITVFETKEELENILEKYFTNNQIIKGLENLLHKQTKNKSDYKKLENIIVKSVLTSSKLDLLKAVRLGITDTSGLLAIVSVLTDLYAKFQDE